MTTQQALSRLQTGQATDIQQVIQEHTRQPEALAPLIESIQKLWRKCLKAKLSDKEALERFGWEGMQFTHRKIKKLPEEIGIFHALKRLTISDDTIRELPISLYELTNLTWLSLNNNELETLEEALGDLHKLQYLNLHGNRFRRLPQRLSQLTQLVGLSLGNNPLEELPAQIGNLSLLKTLNLMGISDTLVDLPASIGNCEALHELTWSHGQRQKFPKNLLQIRSLTHLYLSGNAYTHLPEEIGNLTQLEVLALEGNQLKSLPEGLSRCIGLKTVYLQNNPIEDSLVQAWRERMPSVDWQK